MAIRERTEFGHLERSAERPENLCSPAFLQQVHQKTFELTLRFPMVRCSNREPAARLSLLLVAGGAVPYLLNAEEVECK